MVTLASLFFVLLSPVVANSSPRLKLDLSDGIKDRAAFRQVEKFATTLHHESMVYVGGNGVLYQINFDHSPALATIIVPGNTIECQGKDSALCGNYIMILHKFNETHLVLCATNWSKPQCWLFFNKELNAFINGRDLVLGPGSCPRTPRHDFVSLVVEERLYSVVPDDVDKMYLTGYRKGDYPSRLNSEEKWMEDPRFVAMSPLDDLIYMFFRERYGLENPDVDPWISRIARVCKSDRGGSRQRLLSKWTTFLKARLLCGMSSDNIHFSRIQDAFISKALNDSEDTRVYGIFHSNWNGSAVCVYSMKEIDRTFGDSGFTNFKGTIPTKPRPGACVSETKRLPDEVLAVMENYPEVERSIQSIGRIPMMTNHQNHFTKIVVDSVVGLHGVVSRVLYLAMGDGKIQKVLETGPSTFIIAELTIVKESKPILSMTLDSNRKFLYVTTAKELVRFPLVQCEKYDGTCGKCVQARDPYCGWDYKEQKCVPITSNSKNIIQDLERGDGCSIAQVARLRSSDRETPIGSTVLILPIEEDISVYLSCPKQSYHADYSWRFDHNRRVLPCSTNGDNCLLFINKLSKGDAGQYECISNERGVEHLHADYLIGNNGASSVHLSRVTLHSVLLAVIYQLQW